MYSIILVDDERSLRESIEHLVDWNDNGFDLIGTAQNGLDALELMENKGIPDVIITDIKMPVMNGIELGKKLREEYPTIKIVFLSGYDEFQYALEGIKLNVHSYLLKPISKNEIEAFLYELKEQLDEEVKAVNDTSRISIEYNKNRELIKNSFLNSLLTEQHFQGTELALTEFLVTHNLEFLNHEKILFTVRFAEDKFLDNMFQKNREFQRFSLFQIVQDVAKKYLKGEVFLFSSYIICILTGTSEELADVKDIFTKDVVDTTNKLLKEKVKIGVSENYIEIFETNKAYRETLTALDYTNIDTEEMVIFIGDVEKTATPTHFLYEIDEAAFLLAIKTNDLVYVREIFKKCFVDNHYDGHHRISILRTITSIVYVNCIRALRETIGDVDDYFNQWYQQIFEAVQYDDLMMIQNELYAFCIYTMNEIAENRTQLKNTLVLESLEYLEENFTDPKISLKSMSSHLNVSSSYFSTVFKKETGKSFIDTLTEMKMTKAKELVLTTDYKIFEIASACGYDDQHYFSYSFKKYFGVSPTKMRKNKTIELSQKQKY